MDDKKYKYKLLIINVQLFIFIVTFFLASLCYYIDSLSGSTLGGPLYYIPMYIYIILGISFLYNRYLYDKITK